jgi:type IV pilus assembly protein PilE
MTKPGRSTGFTLIELMIVVVIVGILAAVAYPSYRQYGIRTKRAAATADLMELAQFMEREFTSSGRYGDDDDTLRDGVELPFDQSPQDDNNPAYDLTLSAVSPTAFTLSATPTGTHEDPQCGILTLNNAGVKCIQAGASCSNVTAQQEAVSDCW